MKKLDNFDNCPNCNADWNGGDIAEELLKHNPDYYKDIAGAQKGARSYGWTPENKLQFKRYIGVEIQGEYDGISYYQCPDCGEYWNRFTREHAPKPFKNG